MDRLRIRLLLVDDHPIVLQGLTAALAPHPQIEIAGTSGTLAEARKSLERLQPDVVLLDLRLPDGAGSDLLAEAQSQQGGPAFIVLSTFLTTQYVNAAIAMGASGFLLKTSPVSEIVAAVESVVDGRLAFTAEQLHSSRRAGWTPLTRREHDIIKGVMQGRSNDELSTALRLSRKTVEAYLSRLFERFNVVTRTELAILAEREQWLDLPVQRSGPNRRDPAV
jgi:two-component system nitrate/nitrite response regulator NarL